MNELRKTVKEDLYRYYGSEKISVIQKIRLYGWQYTKTWRVANMSVNKNRLLYFWFGYQLLRKSQKYGFQISPHATIGKGLYIGHFGTIIISDQAVLGDNVNLSPNVVIGAENRGSRSGAPIIGSKVWIGSGAVLVGKISIGDNVMIAPNEFVNYSIPSNSIVLGGKFHYRENAVDGYIRNTV